MAAHELQAVVRGVKEAGPCCHPAVQCLPDAAAVLRAEPVPCTKCTEVFQRVNEPCFLRLIWQDQGVGRPSVLVKLCQGETEVLVMHTHTQTQFVAKEALSKGAR